MRPCTQSLHLLVAGAAVVTAAASPLLWAEDGKSAKETAARKALVGVWKGFTVEGKGENPDRGPVKLELTITEEFIAGKQFKGDKVIDHGKGSFRLDLTTKPQRLDGYQLTSRGTTKAPWLGLYTLEGDTLKWCVAKKTRPKVFETVKGQFLLILKREKK